MLELFSAIFIQLKNDIISEAGISAGGVAAVPAYLSKGSEFLKGKKIEADVIAELLNITQREISPISDARGTTDYKRLLLRQLIKAHFITLYPELETSLIHA